MQYSLHSQISKDAPMTRVVAPTQGVLSAQIQSAIFGLGACARQHLDRMSRGCIVPGAVGRFALIILLEIFFESMVKLSPWSFCMNQGGQ